MLYFQSSAAQDGMKTPLGDRRNTQINPANANKNSIRLFWALGFPPGSKNVQK
jgi:hypothetical protein